LVELNNVIGLFLPFGLPDEQRFHVACKNLTDVLKIRTYRLVHFISFDAIDIFTIHVEVSSGYIEVFSSHNFHAFGHLKPSNHEVLFVLL
jgi:hypothetical protein